jgi:small subunit ribosomal protein S5
MTTRNKEKRNRNESSVEERAEFDERIVDIARVAKVVKGGRSFSFRAVVVAGDNRGRVGYGIGKAKSVTDSIRKATERSRRNLKNIALIGTTIPHETTQKYCGAEVFLKPATPGTGVIAGGAVRAVLECAGVKDILTKSKGSQNKLNVIHATIQGLTVLKDPVVLAKERGKSVDEVRPVWSLEKK